MKNNDQVKEQSTVSGESDLANLCGDDLRSVAFLKKYNDADYFPSSDDFEYVLSELSSKKIDVCSSNFGYLKCLKYVGDITNVIGFEEDLKQFELAVNCLFRQELDLYAEFGIKDASCVDIGIKKPPIFVNFNSASEKYVEDGSFRSGLGCIFPKSYDFDPFLRNTYNF